MEPVLLGRTVRFHPCLRRRVAGRHRPAERDTAESPPAQARVPVTLKMVLIFPPGIRCRECWCPPCHSARPRGSPSPPPASSTLAAGRRRRVSTSAGPGRRARGTGRGGGSTHVPRRTADGRPDSHHAQLNVAASRAQQDAQNPQHRTQPRTRPLQGRLCGHTGEP